MTNVDVYGFFKYDFISKYKYHLILHTMPIYCMSNAFILFVTLDIACILDL